MTSQDLRVSGRARSFDDFTPKLTNSIQNLMKVLVYCLNESPKGIVHYSKPSIVANYMEEHATCSSTDTPSLPVTSCLSLKVVHKAKKGALLILSMKIHSISVEW